MLLARKVQLLQMMVRHARLAAVSRQAARTKFAPAAPSMSLHTSPIFFMRRRDPNGSYDKPQHTGKQVQSGGFDFTAFYVVGMNRTRCCPHRVAQVSKISRRGIHYDAVVRGNVHRT